HERSLDKRDAVGSNLWRSLTRPENVEDTREVWTNEMPLVPICGVHLPGLTHVNAVCTPAKGAAIRS
ncbi:hypothetical protein NDU88_006881, partial [Pleurodeles waltl]